MPPGVRQPPEADRSGREEERKDPGDVVHVRVGHVLATREKVCGELRQRDEREARREHEQTAERNGQENDVEDVVACVTAETIASGSVTAVRRTPAGEPPTFS